MFATKKSDFFFLYMRKWKIYIGRCFNPYTNHNSTYTELFCIQI